MNQIKNFPPEVIEWMLQQQEAQGNKRDKSVFEKNKRANKEDGGFNWGEFGEFGGFDFCEFVIIEENFDLFFERYPRKKSKCKFLENKTPFISSMILTVGIIIYSTVDKNYIAAFGWTSSLIFATLHMINEFKKK